MVCAPFPVRPQRPGEDHTRLGKCRVPLGETRTNPYLSNCSWPICSLGERKMRPQEDSIKSIATNRTSGASELALQSLFLLKQAAASSSAADLSGYMQELYQLA